MTEDTLRSDLKPANANPWYILMTLYGEQEGQEVDWDLHERNRKAWNCFAGQVLSDGKPWEVARAINNGVNEYAGSHHRTSELREKFDEVCKNRSGAKEDLKVPVFKRDAVVDLSAVRFNNLVAFQGFLFPCNLKLNSSVFEKTLVAHNVFIDGSLNAERTKFDGGCRFENSHFSKYTNFGGAEFTGQVCLTHAQFTQTADFSSASFTQEAGFGTATFEGIAVFSDARFGTEAGRSARSIFSNVQFLKPTSWRGARFLNCYPDFSGAVLHDKTSFTAKPEHWPQSTDQDPEQARDRCAVIRHVLAKQGLPEEEHFFFRREMGFARQIGSIWQQLPYHLFGIFSGYGYSLQRPLGWLFVVWFLGLAGFATLFHLENLAVDGHTFDPTDWTAMGLSFSNLFPVFGFGRLYYGAEFMQALPRWAQILSGAQTVAALPLIFFFGLALRQRFRLR